MLGADACAMFIKNQRRFEAPPLDPEDVKRFKAVVKRPELMVVHGSYLINLANPDAVDKAYACFVDEVQRCHAYGLTHYNIHPGSDVKGVGGEALRLIATHLNRAIAEVPDVVILLEIMPGQGRTCGRTFEELARIIGYVEDKARVGVTLDTAHMFGGGYDIRTAEGFEAVMREFDRVVGRGYLKAVHLNDSICELDSRKDRHESLGRGKIGLEAFRYIMNSDYFEDIPMVLETRDPEKYKEEIELLRSMQKAPGTD